MVKRVIFPNLPKCIERKFFMLGWLASKGFQVRRNDFVIPFPAHDGDDYDSPKAVANAAIADGFTHFQKVIDRIENHKQRDIAWQWSFCAVLRMIIARDEIFLYLIDDIYPLWDIKRLQYLTNEAARADGRRGEKNGIKIIQLATATRQTRREPAVEMYSSTLARGLSGREDLAAIISPSGAQLLLNAHQQDPGVSLSTFTQVYRKVERDGLWHTLDDIIDRNPFVFNSTLYGPGHIL